MTEQTTQIKEFSLTVKPHKAFCFNLMRFDFVVNEQKFSLETCFMTLELKHLLMIMFDEARAELEKHFKEAGFLD